ncbi:hypothetical protein GQ457_04G006140 [Hibiscus cannabinus]
MERGSWRRHWQPDSKIHRQRLAQNSDRHTSIVTLYVANIPTTLHWSGLRQTFGRHGDLVDSFIARKQNKAGKRFGFVRFSNKIDAERAIERLNGFKLYGSRLLVSKARSSYWRKINKDTEHQNDREGCKHSVSKKQTTDSLEESESKEKRALRIEGFIQEEDILKLNMCAIGTMATACSTNSVTERLHGWGLGELIIKSMGGRRFLIEFKDKTLFEYFKEEKWSYLFEVFAELEPWTESFHLPERITWIQVEGLPLHCWNQTTFKRIVESWGSLLTLGENGNQCLDCEKVTLLISTKQRNNLDVVMELEAGRDIFLVRIKELGFNIHGMPKANVDNKNDKVPPADMEVVESSSASSSEKEVRQTQVSGDNQKSPLNDASFNAVSLGLSKPDTDHVPRQDPEPKSSGRERCYPNGLYETRFALHNNEFLGQQLPNDNWAERVDSLNSHKPNDDCPISFNPKEDTGKSSNKGKRYGSLANLQDKVISSLERKRRDRGWRKTKKGGVDINSSELEGRSLSDSDLRTRRDFQIKEARKTLEVGNELGIKFLGPAQDVINAICSLEEADFIARQK